MICASCTNKFIPPSTYQTQMTYLMTNIPVLHNNIWTHALHNYQIKRHISSLFLITHTFLFHILWYKKKINIMWTYIKTNCTAIIIQSSRTFTAGGKSERNVAGAKSAVNMIGGKSEWNANVLKVSPFLPCVYHKNKCTF